MYLKRRCRGVSAVRQCCLAFLFLTVAGSVRAVSYSYDYAGMPLSSGRHWEEYVYRYTPGSGWSRTAVAGNKNGNPGNLAVHADDGSTGQVVALDLLFEVYFSSQYKTLGWGIDIGGETEALANFGGLGGAVISSKLDIHGEGFAQPWTVTNLERDFLDNGSRVASIVVPYFSCNAEWKKSYNN